MDYGGCVGNNWIKLEVVVTMGCKVKVPVEPLRPRFKSHQASRGRGQKHRAQGSQMVSL